MVRRFRVLQCHILNRGVAGGAKIVPVHGPETDCLDAPAPAITRPTALRGGDEELPLAIAGEGRDAGGVRDDRLDVVVGNKRDRVPCQHDGRTLDGRAIRPDDPKLDAGLDDRRPWHASDRETCQRDRERSCA